MSATRLLSPELCKDWAYTAEILRREINHHAEQFKHSDLNQAATSKRVKAVREELRRLLVDNGVSHVEAVRAVRKEVRW